MDVPLYDFDRMRLNIRRAHQAMTDIAALEGAFLWDATPQGHTYWQERHRNGLDHEARSTLAFMVAQSIQLEMHGARAAA